MVLRYFPMFEKVDWEKLHQNSGPNPRAQLSLVSI